MHLNQMVTTATFGGKEGGIDASRLMASAKTGTLDLLRETSTYIYIPNEPPTPLFLGGKHEESLDLDGPSLRQDREEEHQGGRQTRKAGHQQRRSPREIRIEEIKIKLAYLNWRKVENSLKIREVLTTTIKKEDHQLLLQLAQEISVASLSTTSRRRRDSRRKKS